MVNRKYTCERGNIDEKYDTLGILSCWNRYSFLISLLFLLSLWPLHPSSGWRYSHIGPRMWPAFPFFGMLILIVAGILVAKYFFQALRDPSISKKDELTLCPYCGKDLRQSKIIPEAQAEKL